MNNYIISINKLRKLKTVKVIAVFVAVNILGQLVYPSIAFALSNGPKSPEFSSFEPVGTSQMVNELTGAFTYNLPIITIPGPDGGSYSMSLSYHSGVSPDQEASWVGYGWTLNPGAINRTKQGFPDDFNEQQSVRYNKIKPVFTTSMGFNLRTEIFSKDKAEDRTGSGSDSKIENFFLKILELVSLISAGSHDVWDNGKSAADDDDNDPVKPCFGVSFGKSVRYNSITGYALATSFGADALGVASVRLNNSGGETTLDYSINPLALIRTLSIKEEEYDYIQYVWEEPRVATGRHQTQIRGIPNATFSSADFNVPAFNYTIPRSISRRTMIHASGEFNLKIQFGGQLGIDGAMQIDMPIPETFVKECGFCYPENLEDNDFLDDDDTSTPVIENDFRIDNPSTFDKHDKYIGVPFANYDVFNVSGQSTYGGFRFHLPKSGVYSPYPMKKVTIPKYLGIDLGGGVSWQVGVGVGVGRQVDKVECWDNSENSYSDYRFNESPAFPQFINDPAADIKYVDQNMGISQPGLRKYEISNVSGKSTLNQSANKQSATIDYCTFGTNFDDYIDKGAVVSAPESFVSIPSELFSQFAVTNPEGETAYYGLPVWTYNEVNLSVAEIESDEVNGDDFKRDDGENKSLIYQPVNVDDPMANLTAVGRKSDACYASQFLMTKITKANYVDENGNKRADGEDTGGWTHFGYRKSCDVYRFRFPYTGLNYDRGSMVDLYDQTGSFLSGETQKYYLQYVETKSHIGFFITNKTLFDENTSQGHSIHSKIEAVANGTLTDEQWAKLQGMLSGSGDTRYDAYDAAAIDESGFDPAASSPTARGEHESEYLEKIVLFSKNDFSKPLKTVNFEYSYDLCRNAPNNSGLTPDQKGKLTLKRVWEEAGDIKENWISPYQFEYEYFRNYPEHILTRDPSILYPEALQENPDYDVNNIDAWGNIRYNGNERVKEMYPWVKQKTLPDEFDPAAWHLKRIITPSGGEIHIQYETNSYTHVQNEYAMTMVSLDQSLCTPTESYEVESGYKYYIDRFDLNINSYEEAIAYKNKLYKHFVEDGNKLYFKMLYAYHGNPNNLHSDANLESTDYVDGFVEVNDVSFDANGIYLLLGNEEDNKDKFLPRWTAYRQLLTKGRFNLGKGTEITENGYTQFNKVAEDKEVYDKVYQLDSDNDNEWMMLSNPDKALRKAITSQIWTETFVMFGNWVGGKIKNYGKKKVCKKFRPEYSYFRLPVLSEKKGGGVRVKRLLTYDKGFNESNATLYGTIYHYVQEDGKTSSGVAINEPAGVGYESPLKKFKESKLQSGYNKLIKGENFKQFIGPLGESLYPGANVFYSRIVSESFHRGKSSPGFVVKEFMTPREARTIIGSYQELDPRKIRLSIPLGAISISVNNFYLTQSYTFYNNSDLLGKPVSETVYPGVYNPDLFKMIQNAFVSRTTYKYTDIREPVQTISYNQSTNNFEKFSHHAGAEESLTMFNSKVSSNSNELRFEVDLNYNNPAITVGIGYSFANSNNVLAQFSTSKEIRRKALLKETITETNGIVQRNEILAYDRLTSNPVLSRVMDGYMYSEKVGDISRKINVKDSEDPHSGWIYNLSLPAYWFYQTLGAKYDNQGNYNRLKEVAFSLLSYGENAVYEFIQDNITAVNNFDNVINATATVYQNNWDNLDENVWLPVATYSYDTVISNSNSDTAALYNGGLLPELTLFDFSNADPSSFSFNNWITGTIIKSYTKDFVPVETENILGLKNSVIYNPFFEQPELVAQNAAQGEVGFLNFETGTGQFTDNTVSHTGNRSLVCASTGSQNLASLNVTQHLLEDGMSVKMWVKPERNTQTGLINENIQISFSLGQVTKNAMCAAQVGEWFLYKAEFDDLSLLQTGNYSLNCLFNNTNNNENIWIDDVVYSPLNSIAWCYVYNIDNKLLAEFNEQHFATIYQYDKEDNLVRVAIETEKGLKTLKEQQVHITKTER